MSVGRLIAATSAALGLWLGVAVAQVPQGRIYVLHSPAAGACPSLDWHIVVEPNDILAGLIAWDDMKTMARATGRVDRPNHTFTMTAVEMGGQGRTATVDGKVEEEWHDHRQHQWPERHLQVCHRPDLSRPSGRQLTMSPGGSQRIALEDMINRLASCGSQPTHR